MRVPPTQSSRLEPMNHRPRASVMECASPLALSKRPRLPRPKRQRTGALQNLAAQRRVMGNLHAKFGAHRDHEPGVSAGLRPGADVVGCSAPGRRPALRFKESVHGSGAAHCDHEPPAARPRHGPRQSSGAFDLASPRKEKRQRTGALQNLAALGRFMGRRKESHETQRVRPRREPPARCVPSVGPVQE